MKIKTIILFAVFLVCNHLNIYAQIVQNANRTIHVHKNVNVNRPGYTGDGSTWDQAVPELADALKWAYENQNRGAWSDFNPLKIFVAKGEYRPLYHPVTFRKGNTKHETFLMVRNVQIFGGFDPVNGIQTMEHKRILPQVGNAGTVLRGLGAANDNVYHIVTSVGDVRTALLDGLVLKDGKADGIEIINGKWTPKDSIIVNSEKILPNLGGSVYVRNSSPLFRNIKVENSWAHGGGGMYFMSSNSKIEQSIFFNNIGLYGAAIQMNGSNLEIKNSIFIKNAALNEYEVGHGGALGIYSSSPRIINSQFSGNYAYTGGGAIYVSNTSSQPILVNVTMSSNFARVKGPAIFLELDAVPKIFNSIIWGNNKVTSIEGGEIHPESEFNLIEGSIIGNLPNIPANLTSEDLFLDYQPYTGRAHQEGDYRLKLNAIPVDQGNETKYQNYNPGINSHVDVNGKSRKSGNFIDLGASEYHDQQSSIVPSSENIIYINANVIGGDRNGSSWEHAHKSLADVLKWAKQNESLWTQQNPLKIWVAAGEYKPKYRPNNLNTDNNKRHLAFTLVKNVQLIGGFGGGELNLNERIIGENETILTGDHNSDDFVSQYGVNLAIQNQGDNSYHTVIAAGDLGNGGIEGFTIKGGNANSSSNTTVNNLNISLNNGGGLFARDVNAAFFIRNILFKLNNAGDRAGGFYLLRSTLNMHQLQFRNNTSNYGGAFFSAETSNAVLFNTVFIGNRARESGAALFVLNTAEVTLINTTSVLNTTQSGRSIFVSRGMLNVYNSIIWNEIGYDAILIESGGQYNAQYSIARMSMPGEGNKNVDPLFKYNFQLGPLSPALDAGNLSLYPDFDSNFSKDILGNSRIFNYDRGGKIDIGAVEMNYSKIQPQINNTLYVDVHVNQQAPGYARDGSSWENALPDLSLALTYASANLDHWTNADPLKIFVAKGTYYPSTFHPSITNSTTRTNNDKSFYLLRHVSLYGGFDPKNGITDLTHQRIEPGKNGSVLSGKLNENSSESVHNVVKVIGGVGAAVLDGFEIRDGVGVGNNGNTYTAGGLTINRGFGGGMLVINSTPRIINVLITNNKAYQGAGITFHNSTARLVNSIIANNQGVHSGGIFVYDSNPELINVNILNNQISDAGTGSAMRSNLTSAPKIFNSIIWGHDLTPIVNVNQANPTFSNSIIQHSFSMGNWNDAFGTDGDNNKNINPGFTNFALGNYTLRNTSPAINAGDVSFYNLPNYGARDFSGNERISGGSIDIGAHEFYELPIQIDQNIIYVNRAVVGGNQSGDTWENAIPELSDVLSTLLDLEKQGNAWWSPEEPLMIFVAKGTYYPQYHMESNSKVAPGDERLASFVMVPNVHIYGGFDPLNGITSLDHERITPMHQQGTILSGNGQSAHVVIAAGPVENAFMDGLLITNGLANNSVSSVVNGETISHSEGVGLYIIKSNPRFNKVWVAGHSNASQGSGILLNNSNAVFSNVIVSENSGSFNGYTIRIINSDAKFINSTIIGEVNENKYSVYVTGIDKHPTFINSIVWSLPDNTDILGSPPRPESANNIIQNGTFGLVLGKKIPLNSLDMFEDFVALIQPPLIGEHDLNLVKGSPAVNRGDGGKLWKYLLDPYLQDTTDNVPVLDDPIWGTDIYGNPRIAGGQIDVGAIESSYIHLDSIKTAKLSIPLGTPFSSITLPSDMVATVYLNNGTEVQLPIELDPAKWSPVEIEGVQYDESIAGTYSILVPINWLDKNDPNWFSYGFQDAMTLQVTVEAVAPNWSFMLDQASVLDGETKTIIYGDELNISYDLTNWDGQISQINLQAIDGNHLFHYEANTNKINAIGPGEVILNVLLPKTNNFEPDTLEFKLIIEPKPLEIIFKPDALVKKDYDGKIHALVSEEHLRFKDGHIINNDQVYMVLGPEVESNFSDALAGDHKEISISVQGITLAGEDGAKYTLDISGVIQAAIGQILKKDLQIKARNHTQIYSGIPYVGGNGVEFTGFVNAESSANLLGTLSYEGSSQGAVEAGVYEILPTGYSSQNYNLIYLPGELTISGGASNELQFNVLQQDQQMIFTYGSGDFDASAVASSGLKVEYLSGNTAVLEVDENGQVKIVGVGNTTITVSQAGNVNYEPANPIQILVTVEPKKLILKAKSATKIFDGIPYSGGNGIEYQGFVIHEDEQVLSGNLQYTGNSQGATNVGTYEIMPFGLQADNYEIEFQAGTLEISSDGDNVLTFDHFTSGSIYTVEYGAPSFSVSAKATSGLPVNYSSSHPQIATVNAQGMVTILKAGITTFTVVQPGNENVMNATPIQLTLEVRKRELVVTANNDGKVYDGQPYSGGNGVLYVGFVHGESESDLQGTLTYHGSSQGAKAVGSFDIVPSGLTSDNYQIIYKSGSLNITKRPVLIVFKPDAFLSKEYDGTTAASVEKSHLTFATGNVISGDDLEITLTSISTAYFQNKVAGANKLIQLNLQGIVLDGAQRDYYSILNSNLIEGNVGEITKAELNITAKDHVVRFTGLPYAGGNGVNFSGFVNGEDESELGGSLTYGGNSQGAESVGTYLIQPQGYTSQNYSISYAPGNLIISLSDDNEIQVEGLTYGDRLEIEYGSLVHKITARASSNLPVTYVSRNPDVAVIDMDGNIYPKQVGETTIQISQSGDSNIQAADDFFIHVKIIPKNLTLHWVAGAQVRKVYDGSTLAQLSSSLLIIHTQDIVPGDEVFITQTQFDGEFESPDAGEGKLVTINARNLSLRGASSRNYVINSIQNLNYTNGIIEKALSKINGMAFQEFVYDGFSKQLAVQLNHAESALEFSPQRTFTEVGEYSITVTVGESRNYLGYSSVFKMKIIAAQRPQINFPPLPIKTYGDAPFFAGASSSSDFTILYTSSHPEIASINQNGQIVLHGAGTVSITAEFPPHSNFQGTSSITQTLQINKATQQLHLEPIGTVNRSLGTIPLQAHVSSGLPIQFQVDNPQILRIREGNMLEILRLGTAKITAIQLGNENYLPSNEVSFSIRVIDQEGDVNIRVHPAVSPNGDGINEQLMIEGIQDYPENRVVIFNRNGVVLFEIKGYNNQDKVFKGFTQSGIKVPSGTYYYLIEVRELDGIKVKKGFFSLQF